LVVGDVEAEEFFFAVFFVVVEEGEYEAAVGDAVVGFPFLAPSVDEGLGFYAFACGHGEMEAVAWFPVGGVEGAGYVEDAEHVVVAVVAFVVVYGPLAVAVEVVLFDVAALVGVGVEDFVHGVVFAFGGSFAEVEGLEAGGGVTAEGVLHGEYGIEPWAALEEEVGAEGWLLLIGGGADGVVGGACFYPNEVPVEVEVVVEVFACLEGVVGVLELGVAGGDGEK